MRKLQAVKEQNNSSEEEDDHTGRFNDYAMNEELNYQQQQLSNADPSRGVELRALNDFTTMFINEEDEAEELDQEDEIKDENRG